MPDSLKTKTKKGVLWSIIDRFSLQIGQFSIGIILARLLTPSDYGIIGIITVFVSLSQVFLDSGFGRALIQRKNIKDIDFSTVFYTNIVIGFLAYLVLFILAPYISVFFNKPELTEIIRIFSINLIISSFTAVQNAIRLIAMDFKSLAKVRFVSVFVGGAIGIYFAYYGYGYWALVFQNLAKNIINTLFLWKITKWLPKLEFSFSSLQELFIFSYKLLLAGLISNVFTNVYKFVIGKIYNTKELGYYTKGIQLPVLLSTTIIGIVQSVSFPLFSKIQDDKKHFNKGYRKIHSIITFVVFPVFTLCAILSEPFIMFFLTEKWIPAVYIMQWFSFIYLLKPVNSLNMNVLNAIGRSDLFLKIDTLKIPILVITLLVTVPFGMKTIVIGQFISSVIAFTINTYYSGRIFKFGFVTQILHMRKTIFSTFIMSICTLLVVYNLDSSLLKLTIGTFVATISYLGISYLINKDILIELLSLIGKNNI